MTLERGLFDDRLCVYSTTSTRTVLSNGGSDYEEDGDDEMVDEVLEFDDNDVCVFVDRAKYYLDILKSSKLIGIDAAKFEQN